MLFLILACTPVTDLAKVEDSAAIEDSASDSGSPTTDDSSIDDSPVDSAVKPDPITWVNSFAMSRGSQTLYDLEYSSELDGFLVSSPFVSSNAGAIMVVNGDAIDYPMTLPDDAKATWQGTSSGSYFGVDISVLTIGGHEFAASNDFCSVVNPDECDYAGRFLMVDVNSDSGIASEIAQADISGLESGDMNSGGYFGAASVYTNEMGVVVSQTNSGDVLYHSTKNLKDLSLSSEMEVLDHDNDDVELGGQGYVAMEMASYGDYFATASNGGFVQGMDRDGTPLFYWTLDEGTNFGALSFADYPDRNLFVYTNIHIVADYYYSVEYVSEDGQGLYLLDPVTGEELYKNSAASVATGVDPNGNPYTVYAVYSYYNNDTDYGGYVAVVRTDETGEEYTDKAVFPLEPPYLCLPRVRTNGANKFAVICQFDNIGFVGEVN